MISSFRYYMKKEILYINLTVVPYCLSEGLSEPEFYGDLVYKFKKLKGINDFSFQFRKIITRYKRIGYNLNVMRQSACLVFNPIMVDNYAAFFNCTPVGRASAQKYFKHQDIKQKEPPQKYRLGTISNTKLLAGLNRFYTAVTSPSASAVVHNI